VGSRRLFVALPVDQPSAALLARFASRWADARISDPASLHATLVFCGAVAADRAGEVVAVTAGETPTGFRWRLEPDSVRLLGTAISVVCRHHGVRDLQARLAGRLAGAGLATVEPRDWLCHVTVARVRGRSPALADRVEPPPVVLCGSTVVVYESVASPRGARYMPVAVFPDRDAAVR
jgi:2'-5' RNA ligase